MNEFTYAYERWEPWDRVRIVEMDGPIRIYDSCPSPEWRRPVGFTAVLRDGSEPRVWEGDYA